MNWVAIVAVLLTACQAPAPTSPSTQPRDGGVPAADAVVEAFASHQVVAIGEWHRWAAEHEFLRALVGDPRLTGVLGVVAVEFGSARHQRTIDRYVAGRAVSEAELALVWTDTTQQSGVWDAPVYRQFFDSIRELNQEREDSERIRVLLGDPPIDWDEITATTGCDDSIPSCLDYWIFRRDEHFASVVLASVDSGRRVLVIAGTGHVLRNPATPEAMSLVDRLDAANPGQVWTLVPPDPARYDELPAELAGVGLGAAEAFVVHDTPQGAMAAGPLFTSGTVTCDPAPCPSEAEPEERLDAVTDALLFLP